MYCYVHCGFFLYGLLQSHYLQLSSYISIKGYCMKSSYMMCLLSISIVAEQAASNSPHLPPALQLELEPASRPCIDAQCAAKSCVACCWTMALVTTSITCLLNDLSCGVVYGRSAWGEPFDDDTLICTDACPSYCMPNTRHGLRAILDCRPKNME